MNITKIGANYYRWAFIANDVFGVNLCTLIQRNAWVHRQFALETLTAAIRPRGVYLQTQ